MSLRSYSEISEEVLRARDERDGDTMLRCAAELDQLGTSEAQALAARTRGSVYFLRDHNTALAMEQFQRALELFEHLDDREELAKTLRNMAEVYEDLGSFADALEHYRRALGLFSEGGHLLGVGMVRRRMAIILKDTGFNAEAYSMFHQALETFQTLGLQRETALTLNNIGIVHKNSGRYPEALNSFAQSMAIFEEINDRGGAALVTANIGGLYYLINDYSTALIHEEQALAIYESLGDEKAMATSFADLGNLHIVQDKHDLGLDYYRRALAISEKSGSQADIINHTGLMLGALVRMGRTSEAELLLARLDAMPLERVSNRLYREACRAGIQELRGMLDDARTTLLAALSIVQEHHDPFFEAELHGQLRDLALKQNDLASYVEHNNAYQRINEEINGKETTSRLAVQEAERRMELERQEHEKQLAILHSTLPKHIADRVSRGEQVNDHYDNAAVMFVDIVGFTSLSDQLSSNEVVQLLGSVFTSLDAVCKKHHVVKIKTIGDSYMAVAFPITVPHSVRNDSSLTSERREESVIPNEVRNEVWRAAGAALEMLTTIADIPESLPASLREALPEGLQVRIGLHCGPVTAGVIGTERLQYDVWGDTVNVASRMESTSIPGRIHVSESFANVLNSEMAKERKSERADVIPSVSEEGEKDVIPSVSEEGEKDVIPSVSEEGGKDVIPSVSEEGETAQERKSETAVIPSDSEEPFPIPYSLFPRGEMEIKGKGMMTTYWLESLV